MDPIVSKVGMDGIGIRELLCEAHTWENVGRAIAQ